MEVKTLSLLTVLTTSGSALALGVVGCGRRDPLPQATVGAVIDRENSSGDATSAPPAVAGDRDVICVDSRGDWELAWQLGPVDANGFRSLSLLKPRTNTASTESGSLSSWESLGDTACSQKAQSYHCRYPNSNEITVDLASAYLERQERRLLLRAQASIEIEGSARQLQLICYQDRS